MTQMRLKHLLTRNDGGIWGKEPTGMDDTIVLRSTEQNADGGWRIETPAERALSPSERSRFQLRENDIVVTKSSGSELHIGKASIVSRELASLLPAYSNFMQRLRVKRSACPRYVWHLLNSSVARFHYNIEATSTSGLGNLTAGIIGNAPVPVTDRTIQRNIADFLDRETAGIDQLIEKKQQLLGLLEEKVRSQTTALVTRGLGPSGDLADTGIEWLPKAPAHWRVRRIATLFRESEEMGETGLPVLSVSIHWGISDRELSDEDRHRIVNQIEDKTAYKRVRPGDLVYNMMRAWQGAFGVATIDGLVSPAYVVARPNEAIYSPYFEALLRTPMCVEEFRRASKGIADFRQRLYWEHFRQVRVILPPIEEQRAIADKIQAISDSIDRVKAPLSLSIDRLREFRSAIITAAVSGKVDTATWRLDATARYMDRVEEASPLREARA